MTTSQPCISHRFTSGNPTYITEVITDRQSKTKWVRLWILVDRTWHSFEFDRERLYNVLHILEQAKKVLR